MLSVFKKFFKGIVLEGQTSDPTDNIEGSAWSNSTSDRIKSYIEGGVKEIITDSQSQTLTNKSIDADLNIITNIENADIKAGAAIDAAKIANGSVSNTEFQYLDGVTSPIQTQINSISGSAITSLTGDVVASGPGSATATIAANAVTNAKLAQMAAHTFKGNNTGSTANASDLTATQLTAELNQFTNSLQGVVPGSGGGTTNFLRADGSWAIPPGSAGANTALSNLASTAVNVNIVPASDNTINLGDTTLRWNRLNVTDIRSGTFDAFSVSNRILYNTAGNDMINFATAGVVNFQTNKLINLTDPLNPQDAATKNYVDTTTTANPIYIKKDGTVSFTGDQSMGNHKLTNVTDPTSSQDAATKAYVDINAGAGRNYIINKGAEVDTSGWATYQDAASSVPVNGTGGAPSITWTRSTSLPLRGTGSFVFTKGGSNLQGEGASYDFTIDSADQAKVLTISFDYTSLTAVNAMLDGDLTVYIYDVTNSQIIQPAGYTILATAQNVPITHVATFQTNSNSTSYRFIIHLASTTTNSWAVKFDNFLVGPASVINGTPVTDFTDESSLFTFSAGFGTTTNAKILTKRIGDSLKVLGSVTVGTVAASVGYIQLPSKYVINTSILGSVSKLIGTSNSMTSATTNITGASATRTSIFYDGSTNNQIFLSFNTTSGDFQKENANTFLASNQEFKFQFEIPIQGWSSNVLISSDTDTRAVAASIGLTTTVNPTANTAIKFDTSIFDTHNAYSTSTGLYTAPISGKYQISVITQATGTGATLYAAVNGTNVRYLYISEAGSTRSGSTILELNANDTVGIFVDTNSSYLGNSPSLNTFSIQRISGPSIIAATESVNAKYFSDTTSRSIDTTTPMQWPTKSYDSHGAVTTGSGWKFTAPISGIYRISATGALGTSNRSISIYKNGTIDTLLTDMTTTDVRNGSQCIKLSANEYIDLRPSGSALFGSDSTHAICIERIGN